MSFTFKLNYSVLWSNCHRNFIIKKMSTNRCTRKVINPIIRAVFESDKIKKLVINKNNIVIKKGEFFSLEVMLERYIIKMATTVLKANKITLNKNNSAISSSITKENHNILIPFSRNNLFFLRSHKITF